MTRIAATEECRFCVKAPLEDVYNFFAEPNRFGTLLDGLDKLEVMGEGRVRWVLKEKVNKGIRFKADYTVVYEGNGFDHVHWRFLEGNMGNEGDVRLTVADDGSTEIFYREVVEPDLPITPIMARLLWPIVARELREDVVRFLDRVKARLEAL